MITKVTFQFSKDFGTDDDNADQIEEAVNEFIAWTELAQGIQLDIVNEQVVCTEPSD